MSVLSLAMFYEGEVSPSLQPALRSALTPTGFVPPSARSYATPSAGAAPATPPQAPQGLHLGTACWEISADPLRGKESPRSPVGGTAALPYHAGLLKAPMGRPTGAFLGGGAISNSGGFPYGKGYTLPTGAFLGRGLLGNVRAIPLRGKESPRFPGRETAAFPYHAGLLKAPAGPAPRKGPCGASTSSGLRDRRMRGAPSSRPNRSYGAPALRKAASPRARS